jgi:hypothetical protein
MSDVAPAFLQERYLFLKSQLPLDLLAIDESLERIAVLIQDAGECMAQANEIRDSAKENYTIVSAKIQANLRGQTLAGGKERSEARISSEFMVDPEYQTALTMYQDARLDAALWETVYNGLQTKSYSLRVAADAISSGFLTNNYLMDKRRAEIRGAKPRSEQT